MGLLSIHTLDRWGKQSEQEWLTYSQICVCLFVFVFFQEQIASKRTFVLPFEFLVMSQRHQRGVLTLKAMEPEREGNDVRRVKIVSKSLTPSCHFKLLLYYILKSMLRLNHPPVHPSIHPSITAGSQSSMRNPTCCSDHFKIFIFFFFFTVIARLL